MSVLKTGSVKSRFFARPNLLPPKTVNMRYAQAIRLIALKPKRALYASSDARQGRFGCFGSRKKMSGIKWPCVAARSKKTASGWQTKSSAACGPVLSWHGRSLRLNPDPVHQNQLQNKMLHAELQARTRPGKHEGLNLVLAAFDGTTLRRR